VVDVLAEVWRGQTVESVHYGHAAVVDREGTLRAFVGEPDTVTYYRSSAKPFQTMALILSGAADRFGLSSEELALCTSSHSGEPVHTQGVARLLERIGCRPEDLRCGAAPPLDRETAERLAAPPGVLHANCSGKHTGMLAQALCLGADLASYLEPGHPVQQRVLAVVAAMADLPAASIGVGVDGCGVPCFALPLRRMAYAYARLGDTEGLPPALADAARRVTEAMAAHPYLIAGRGRFDTDLMRVTQGRVLVKGGSEGLACLTVPELGLGLAVKVADGNARALGPSVVAILRQLKLLTAAEEAELAEHARPAVRNLAGLAVGEIRPALALKEVVV
jgi:L-asparaginase II